MFKNKLNYKLLNILMFAVIIYLALITSNYWWGFIGKIISILTPFIAAFAIAYALNPAVRKLQEKGVRRNLAVTMVVVTIAIVIIGISWMTIHLFYDQLIVLSSVIGDVLNDISNKFSVNLGDFRNTVNNIMNNVIQSVGNYLSSGTINLVNKSVNLFTNIIIVAIVSIYFLADMENIRNNVKSILKKGSEDHFLLAKSIDKELGRYLSGLAIFMIIQFFEYSN